MTSGSPTSSFSPYDGDVYPLFFLFLKGTWFPHNRRFSARSSPKHFMSSQEFSVTFALNKIILFYMSGSDI
jgi:hypothetical protein